jgi:hypothetical protein
MTPPPTDIPMEPIFAALKQLYGAACVELRIAKCQEDRDLAERHCEALENLFVAWGFDVKTVIKFK